MYEVSSMTGVLVLYLLGVFLRKQQLGNGGGDECVLVMGSCKQLRTVIIRQARLTNGWS